MTLPAAESCVFVGIGGWNFAPWRGVFYPPKWPQAKELEYASRHVSAIEINATYYKLQKPDLFRRWAATAPDGFKFAVKASRFCTNRKLLGDGGEAIAKFVGQGLIELGDKLGPILWQFMGTKRFEPEDFQAFLNLLPASEAGVPLRHVVEPRHESFRDPAFVAMARAAGVGITFADADDYPCIPDLSGDLVYARLQRSRQDEPTGYDDAALGRWAGMARTWSRGESPPGLPYAAAPPPPRPRETFIFFISGAKVRNPAAARALIARLDQA